MTTKTTKTTTAINTTPVVSLDEAYELIVSCPNVTFLLSGPPGIGKTYMRNRMMQDARLMHTHAFPPVVDVPNLDIGEAAMPVVDREKMVTNYAPNSRFMLTCGKPVVLFLDEITKGATPVKNMLNPLMERHARRMGDITLQPGSIVVGTGNLGTDGLGDTLQAHTRNRIVVLVVRPPTAEEWRLNFAIPKGLNGAVIRWVEENPQCLDFYYTTSVEGNPYPYNPRVPQTAFVSGRSLETAADVVDQYVRTGTISPNALVASLSGAVGESAARDMEAHIAFQMELPKLDVIVANPDSAPVPTDPGACAVLIYSMVSRIDTRNISPVVRYISRLSREWQAAFVFAASKSPKQHVLYGCEDIKQWLLRNESIL